MEPDVRWSGSEGEEEEDAPERRGFQEGVNFGLGAIEQLTRERERERERERKRKGDKQKSTKQFNIRI